MTRLLAAGIVLFAAAAAFQEAEVVKTVADAKQIKKSARTLDAAGRAKVEEALGAKISDADAKEPIYEAQAVVAEVGGSEAVPILWIAVTVRGVKGEIRLGVARAQDDAVVVAVVALKSGDLPEATDGALLKQFESFLISENLHQPPAKLAEALKKEGLSKTLSATSESMFKVGHAWDKLEKLLANGDAASKAEADAVAEAFGKVEPLVAKYEHLKESQREAFTKNLATARKQLKQISALVTAKNFVDARALAHEAGEGCSRCHAGTRKWFRPKREELGIGNGNFAAGVDFAPTSPEAREAQQNVATGVRKALLILEAAK